tara:strand:- start:467 stop:805 length:339 start_codon:yes stop_codon:yes gene_type:complete
MNENSKLKERKYFGFFKNLASPMRASIIASLGESPKTVNELVSELGVEQSALSHALRSLKQCKFVSFEQKGKHKIYSLNDKTILPVLNLIDKHAQDSCACESCSSKHCEACL